LSSNDELKIFAEIKNYLENEIAMLEEKLTVLKRFRNAVDKYLAKSSFKTAEEISPKTKEEKIEKRVLRDSKGVAIASLVISGDLLTIIPEKEVKENSPPLRSFFLGRVLSKMKADDIAAFKQGKLPERQILEYDVVSEGGVLQEITIRNARDRLEEIERTVRWALEKAFERQ